MRNIYDEVINDLKECIKEKPNLTIRKRKKIIPPKSYTPEEIKKLREDNNFTQAYFGELLGVSIKTVQAWEAGVNEPSGTAKRLFQLIEAKPEMLKELEILI